MILVDTSVWIDHLRVGDPTLVGLLNRSEVMVHPFVIGEIALGSLRHRDRVLDTLDNLPRILIATDREVLHFVDKCQLHGLGIGYIDVHLLAAVRLSSGARLWTRDKRLSGVAHRLGLGLSE